MSLKLKSVQFNEKTLVIGNGALRYKTYSRRQWRLDHNYPGSPGGYAPDPFGVAGSEGYRPWNNAYHASVFAALPYSGYVSSRLYNVDPPYTGETDVWGTPPWTSVFVHSSVPRESSSSSLTRTLKYLEVINSSNTVGWPGPQGTRVGGLVLTKNKPPTNRPKEPIYHMPKLKPSVLPAIRPPVKLLMIPPTRNSSEGLSAYQIRLDRWTYAKERKEARLNFLHERDYKRKVEKVMINLSENKRRITVAQQRHKEALLSYKNRLSVFLEMERQSKDLTYHKAPIRPKIPQDNPYGHIKMTFIGVPVFTEAYGTEIWSGTTRYIYGTHQDDDEVWEYHYKQTVLDERLSRTQLARYAEDTRTYVFGIINPFLEEHDERLRRKIHEKLRNQQVHIGNIIAERKQTLDLVQSSVKRILSLIKLKRNAFKAIAKSAKNAKQIASDILAFKFGVEPLMNDISTFAKYLDSDAEGSVVVVRVNTGGNKALPIKVVTPLLTFTGFVEISYVIKCTVDNPAARSLSEFGLINPLEILWEVTPWSFVVDWFFPVGDWLASKTAMCGISFKTGTRKVRLVGEFLATSTQSNIPSSDPSGGLGDVPFVSFVGELTDRAVISDIPDLPPIRLKNPLSWSHSIESVALAVQRLKIR